MKRSEAFWILDKMYADANEKQKQALAVAQNDIQFLDLIQAVQLQRWIPVAERLPTEEDEGENEGILAVEKKTKKVGTWWYMVVADAPDLFTHWMPLPAPPKDGDT